jgi:DNA polymerase III alpha subunit
MNENYDKYRELLVLNKPILVVGEVNNAEDKPKIFPQEIMALEEAPKKFTKQVHLRMQMARLTPDKLDAARKLIQANPGRCPLFLCFIRPSGEICFVEAHEKYYVAPSWQLQKAVDELLGPDTYYAKADLTVPERPQRRWERGNNGNNDQ